MGLNASQHLKLSTMKKCIVGLTGLLLCGFLLAHLAGNILILYKAEAFNSYAHKLTSTPLIYVAEAGLIGIFIVHIIMAIKVTIENRQARPIKYRKTPARAPMESFATTMPYTGVLILVFLIWHIATVKFAGDQLTISYPGVGEVRNLHAELFRYFKSPVNVIGYCGFMLMVGCHVVHGLWSACQSLGINRPKTEAFSRKASLGFAVLTTLSFITFAIYCYATGGPTNG